MKKKESLLVVIMGIITVAVIFMGFTYNKNRKEELLNNNHYEAQSQSDSFNERKRAAEEKKKAEFLGAFEKNREAKSTADFLEYVVYNKKSAGVAFYGDVKDGAPWASQAVDTLIQERNLQKVKKHFIPTEDIQSEKQLKKLIKTKADVVFLTIPEKGEMDSELEETDDATKEIFKTYDAIKESLPDALVVLLAPAPRVAIDEETQEETALQQAYIDELSAVAGEHKLPFFNLHNALFEKASSTETGVSGLYDEAGQLNEAGTQMLTDVFVVSLRETVVDTTTAFHAEGKKAAAESVVKEEESSSEEESSLEEEISSEEIESEEEIIEESEEPEWVEPEFPDETVDDPVWEAPEEESSSTWTPPATTPTPPVTPETPPVKDPEPKPEPEPEPEPEPKPDPEPDSDPKPDMNQPEAPGPPAEVESGDGVVKE